MRSIALFPCSYTDGATIIGELINALHLPVYTDDMLFSDVSDQFGIPLEKLNKVIFGQFQPLHRYMLKRKKYVNCLRCSLDAQTMRSRCGRLHYGFHTSLLDFQKDSVLKILVFDDEDRRIKRAMRQEGFPERVAVDHVHRHDAKVSDWTNFLSHKQAYDRSLYDVVIPRNNKNSLDIAADIIAYLKDIENLATSMQIPALASDMYLDKQVGWTG